MRSAIHSSHAFGRFQQNRTGTTRRPKALLQAFRTALKGDWEVGGDRNKIAVTPAKAQPGSRPQSADHILEGQDQKGAMVFVLDLDPALFGTATTQLRCADKRPGGLFRLFP